MGGARFLLATSALAMASAAQAGETVRYSYDSLGRLVATTSTGTVNNGLATRLGYDPAGNRSTYTVTPAPGGSGGTPPPPTPPPPPPPPPPAPSAAASAPSAAVPEAAPDSAFPPEA